MLLIDARHLTDTTPLLHEERVLLRFFGKKSINFFKFSLTEARRKREGKSSHEDTKTSKKSGRSPARWHKAGRKKKKKG